MLKCICRANKDPHLMLLLIFISFTEILTPTFSKHLKLKNKPQGLPKEWRDVYNSIQLKTHSSFFVGVPNFTFWFCFRWPHQVRSYGSRNLAVNIWWAHFTTFNHTDCEESPFKDEELLPLSLFEFHPSEAIRYQDVHAVDLIQYVSQCYMAFHILS